MTVLFEKVALPQRGDGWYVLVTGHTITSITKERPRGDFDKIVGGEGCLLTPGLCNAHTHTAMTILRGYGEDLPLQRWLEERIFPAEDRLTYRSVQVATKVAIAEMLKNGIASFSDMYMFEDAVAEAVLETGIKANLSRSFVSFDPDADIRKDSRFDEFLHNVPVGGLLREKTRVLKAHRLYFKAQVAVGNFPFGRKGA